MSLLDEFETLDLNNQDNQDNPSLRPPKPPRNFKPKKEKKEKKAKKEKKPKNGNTTDGQLSVYERYRQEQLNIQQEEEEDDNNLYTQQNNNPIPTQTYISPSTTNDFVPPTELVSQEEENARKRDYGDYTQSAPVIPPQVEHPRHKVTENNNQYTTRNVRPVLYIDDLSLSDLSTSYPDEKQHAIQQELKQQENSYQSVASHIETLENSFNKTTSTPHVDVETILNEINDLSLFSETPNEAELPRNEELNYPPYNTYKEENLLQDDSSFNNTSTRTPMPNNSNNLREDEQELNVNTETPLDDINLNELIGQNSYNFNLDLNTLNTSNSNQGVSNSNSNLNNIPSYSLEEEPLQEREPLQEHEPLHEPLQEQEDTDLDLQFQPQFVGNSLNSTHNKSRTYDTDYINQFYKEEGDI